MILRQWRESGLGAAGKKEGRPYHLRYCFYSGPFFGGSLPARRGSIPPPSPAGYYALTREKRPRDRGLRYAMSNDPFSFSIGAIEAWILRDGQFSYPTAHFFANADPEALAEGAEDYALTARQVRTPYHAVYLETGSEQILIDTGAGPLGAHAEQVLPDIDHATTAPGHTPGHLILTITSEGEQLVHLADLVLHPLLMERPDWTCGFDLDPETAAESRAAILAQMQGPDMPCLGYHLPPSPGLGTVQRKETGWGWQPVATGG